MIIIFPVNGPEELSVLCAVDSVVNSLTNGANSIFNYLTNDVGSGWNGATSYLGSLGDGVYGTLTCKPGIAETRWKG